MRAAALFGDLDIRGLPAEGMTESFAERLGRALGTLARRKGSADTGFVIARDDGEALAHLRDGLVRGLVLSGQRVTDLGVLDATRYGLARIDLERSAGVFLRAGEDLNSSQLALEIVLGGDPLIGEGLTDLRDIAVAGDFSAGTGTLELLSPEPAAARTQGS